MQAQYELGSYIHAYTNKTRSLANLQSTRFNPYFGWFVLLIIMSAKVGITLVDLLENVFPLCIHGCNYLARIVFA